MVLQMEVGSSKWRYYLYLSGTQSMRQGRILNLIFIGSEGTLGIITKAQMRIYEQPGRTQVPRLLFQDMTSAFRALKGALQKFKPSVMRLYDLAETTTPD